ncbi:MAG TPA: hypothetical protein VGO00_19970 [Kofleriaceae bacterium]|jgi:hypothetical protein|nr:hypothetical protein [Kofleriaceae bacterium]
MATKKQSDSESKKAAKAKAAKAKPKAPPKKVAKAPKAPEGKAKARHPKARVIEGHKSKKELAKSLAELIARADEDTDQIAERLRTASNRQLLRLQSAAERMKSKYGDRTKLIAAITSSQNKAKDQDYVAKLDTYSLPQLLDLAARG